METTLKFDVIKHYEINDIEVPKEINDKIYKGIEYGDYANGAVVEWLKKLITIDDGDDVLMFEP